MEDIVIKIYPNKALADLAKSILETNGIKSVTQTIGGGPRIPNINGRTALRVLKNDVQKARKLLEMEPKNYENDTIKRYNRLFVKQVLLIVIIIIIITLVGIIITLFKTVK